MSVIGAFIVPHPPIILPQIGHGEEKKIQKTIDAYREVAKRIADLKPETIVITSPHSVMYADYFHISPRDHANGNLKQFNAPDVSISAEYDVDFVVALEDKASEEGISAGTMGERSPLLDHGSIIPLSFINEKYTDYKLVRIGLSGLPVSDHYKLGMCIADVANYSDKDIVFVASGDLSHKLLAEGPYGYAQEGVEFDEQITKAMSDGDFLKFLTFPSEFTDKAAECGLRSFIIMAGAMDGKDVESKLLSYEGTFGVGYGVASFIPTGNNEERKFLDEYLKTEYDRMKSIKENEDEYVRLARYSVEHFVKTGDNAQRPSDLLQEMQNNRAGVFVSLKKYGNLRGCIGTIAPTTGSIAEEILRNAVCACSEDPRFEPVTEDELKDIVYSVDVLSEPEPIASADMLDVERYGVIVTCGYKRGLLLPNLEGVDTVDEQISIAMKKAGIHEDEKYSLERFEVVRHK